MQTQLLQIWWLRLATFLLAAMAAGSTAYWVMKWLAVSPQPQTSPVVFQGMAQADPQVVARLLGSTQGDVAAASMDAVFVPESASSRFKLIGVVAQQGHGGYALISVEGKPAKPYQVGAPVSDTLVLQSVAPRSAALAGSLNGPAAITLALPALPQP